MCIFHSKFLRCIWLILLFRPAVAEPWLTGAPAIEQSLRRLNVLGSVLMIGAHPDDENNVTLAWLGRGRHYHAAYLSITRGEGGQNLLGPELGEALGLIRTQELLAARRMDGAEQFFTRAVDFGFSKSAEETFGKWGHDRILADVVWAIRKYRPDVVTTSFTGTPRDGHGHHQASGMLAREAFAAAADPARFPEQLRFVKPWQARRLAHHSFSPAGAPAGGRIEGGEFNPILGRSYSEIAGISRSMHRSQAMGSAEPRGAATRQFAVLAGEPAAGDLFDGIDTTWKRLPGGAEPGRILAGALAGFDAAHPERTVPLLLEARPHIAAIEDPWAAVKLRELDEAVALCTGLWLDAQAGAYEITPGGRVTVRMTALNRSPFPLKLVAAALEGAPGDAGPVALPYNQAVTREASYTAPVGQPYSQPYWLVEPRRGEFYEVKDQQSIGLAENPPVLRACFRIEAAGQTLEYSVPVEHRYVDPLYGERTRPLVVVPPVVLNVPRDVAIFPSGSPKTLRVEAGATVAGASGEVTLELNSGWKGAGGRPFRIERAGQRQSVEFQIAPPAKAGTSEAHFAADIAGRRAGVGMQVISYPHFPPQTWFPPAVVKLVREDVRVAARRVGYVMGAGDEAPHALRQLGCEVALLSAADLEQGDLAGFDAIVTGVRAYNVRPDLRANQPRLLAYVRNGGRLIVQYNVLDATLKGVDLGPYPLTIGRGRVTEEEAPVTFADPASPLLRAPNAITAADFKGWVQERGLYFAEKWDPRYQPVMQCADAGEAALAGGELWARYGKGVYVFTAYSWFRQLPAGVPGAYRLFANLLSAK